MALLAELPREELETRAARRLLEVGQFDRAEDILAHATDPSEATRRTEMADLWLQLARALLRHDAPRAQAALDHAVRLGSVKAIAMRAQQLERQHRFDEAVDYWRDAVRAAPRESAHAFALARLYERLGHPEAALGAYLAVLDAAPSLANHLMLAERLDQLALPEVPAARTVRIALLGNATLDQLKSYLKVECYRAGLRPVLYQCGFDQYSREILDPHSDLYAFGPDFVVCAIHPSRLFPTLHHDPLDASVSERRAEMEAGLQTLQHLLDTLTQRSGALVLLHNMVVPQYPALGILDARDELGQVAAFGQINARLAELARGRYRNVYVVDEDGVQARVGKASATDQRLWFTARMPWSEHVLASLSREYLRYIRAARGLSRKCIIFDLDNTVWGGVIGEDGIGRIQLGSDAPGNAFVAFQRELVRLWRRGVLLAACSKNNPEDVLPVFERHPEMILKSSHLAAQRINWQPKAANIREIARELNLGLDSLVFLDDNPVERAAVRAELPDVLVPELPTDPSGYRRALLELAALFDTLALTAEDRQRTRLYAEQQARQAMLESVPTGGSLDGYLADLGMVVEIEPANDVTLPRIAQLTAKTNQFNLTTRRYTEADIAAFIARGWRVYTARVRDRFGDNGLTGVAIVVPDGEAWSIDTLLLSCRVMGRGVETALLAQVADEARAAGARALVGDYVPTPKNSVVRGCYEAHGFAPLADTAEGTTSWRLDLVAQSIEVPAYLTVRASVTAH